MNDLNETFSLDNDEKTRTIDDCGHESFRAAVTRFTFVPSPKKPSLRVSPRKRKSEYLDVSQKISASGPCEVKKRSSIGRENESARNKKKGKRGYAGPEAYAHLEDLTDILSCNLDVVFCGINPGKKSAEIGHHFGHPTNHFWICLHESGFTSERLPPQEDHTLPERFQLGITNLVERVTVEESELSPEERVDGISILLSKIAKYRPRVLCFIGLGIARTVFANVKLPSSSDGSKVKRRQAKAGLQIYKMVHSSQTPSPNSSEASNVVAETLFYALPCTSGRVVVPQRKEKVELFARLRNFVAELKAGGVDTENIHPVLHP